MKRSGILLVMVMLLAGCATTTVSNLVANNNMSMVHLRSGMSKCSVLAMMKSGVNIYNCDRTDKKYPSKVTISNPYHAEMMQIPGRSIEVLYYVTNLRNSDCMIEEEDLTPLVFENGKLIGWGGHFLAGLMPEAKPQDPVVQAPVPVAVQVPVSTAVEKTAVEQKPEVQQPAQNPPAVQVVEQKTEADKAK
jgi:hypothetical protein